MKKILIIIASIALSINTFAQESIFKYPTEGYRGFAGINIFNGIEKFQFDRFAISTTHGFQSDNIYVGMGTSLQFTLGDYYYYDDDDNEIIVDFMMPFYIDLNYELLSSKALAPFADVKLGYAVGDANGLYVLPSVGLRLAHINIWAGYNFIQDKYTQQTYNGELKKQHYFHSIAFGVFFDWGARND